MTHPNPTTSKVRALVDDALLEADGAFPTFPDGSASPVVFAGDFKGAKIAGFEFRTGAFTTVSALDGNIEHSHDGTTWHVLKALTQATAPSNTYTPLLDSDPKPMRYLRVDLSATGSFGSVAGVQVNVCFNQCGAPGSLVPPGRIDRHN